jgi:RNA methyltransferase, TrmH family
MSEFVISSLQNPQVKNVVKLRERRQRERQGLMIIEGYRELRRALDARWSMTTVFHCEDWFQGTNEPRLLADARAMGCKLIAVSQKVFQKMAYRDRPEGLLALAEIPKLDLGALKNWWESFENKKQVFFLVAESIEKPGNLGTILRTADAAGVDAVIVCDKVTDLFNPNVVRASLGTLFCVPVFQLSSEDYLSWLETQKIESLAATPAAKELYTSASMTRPCAVVIGSEQYGLSELWMTRASSQVRIPMLGQADSLNAAQAATLLMFEVVRQSTL